MGESTKPALSTLARSLAPPCLGQTATHRALELRALRSAGEGREELLLPPQRREAKSERAVCHGRSEIQRTRALRSEPGKPGFHRRAGRFHAEPGWRSARLRAFRRRHGLADVEIPPRRRWQGSRRYFAPHEILGRELGTR